VNHRPNDVNKSFGIKKVSKAEKKITPRISFIQINFFFLLIQKKDYAREKKEKTASIDSIAKQNFIINIIFSRISSVLIEISRGHIFIYSLLSLVYFDISNFFMASHTIVALLIRTSHVYINEKDRKHGVYILCLNRFLLDLYQY
jgi:hypothetical protein